MLEAGQANIDSFAESLLEDIFPTMEEIGMVLIELSELHAEDFKNQLAEYDFEIEDKEVPPIPEEFMIQSTENFYRSVLSLRDRQEEKLEFGQGIAANAPEAFQKLADIVRESQDKLESLIQRWQIHFLQQLDEMRQKAFGLTHYIWRTQDDERVRSSHAENDDRVFRWDDDLDTGHPGHEWGCRCRAELFPLGVAPVADPAELLDLVGLGSGLVARRALRTLLLQAAQLRREKNSELAKKIANGHAYREHVIRKGEFPEVSTVEDFEEIIEDILNNPDDFRELEDGRRGYWDDETGTVVIETPTDEDGGTTFRPPDGKNYFDNVLH